MPKPDIPLEEHCSLQGKFFVLFSMKYWVHFFSDFAAIDNHPYIRYPYANEGLLSYWFDGWNLDHKEVDGSSYGNR